MPFWYKVAANLVPIWHSAKGFWGVGLCHFGISVQIKWLFCLCQNGTDIARYIAMQSGKTRSIKRTPKEGRKWGRQPPKAVAFLGFRYRPIPTDTEITTARRSAACKLLWRICAGSVLCVRRSAELKTKSNLLRSRLLTLCKAALTILLRCARCVLKGSVILRGLLAIGGGWWSYKPESGRSKGRSRKSPLTGCGSLCWKNLSIRHSARLVHGSKSRMRLTTVGRATRCEWR